MFKNTELAKAFYNAKSQVYFVQKNKDNPFHKSKYADLSMVLEVLKPALLSAKIQISFPIRQVDGQSYLGVVFVNHVGDSEEVCLLPILAKDTTAQSFGSALTYSKRQACMSIFGLAAEDEDDDGHQATYGKPMQSRDKVVLTSGPEKTWDERLKECNSVQGLRDLHKAITARMAPGEDRTELLLRVTAKAGNLKE